MKLKKKTSILMAASAAVAVVGIAAVSFAAWQGSNNTVTASASTGTVVLEGISTDADKEFTLVPYDQDNGSIKDGDKIAYIPLKVVAYEDFEIVASTESNLGFMIKYDTTAPEAFDGKNNAPGNTTGYSAADGAKFEGNLEDLTATDVDNDTYTVYAYIILDSTTTTDAGQTGIEITFTLNPTANND